MPRGQSGVEGVERVDLGGRHSRATYGLEQTPAARFGLDVEHEDIARLHAGLLPGAREKVEVSVELVELHRTVATAAGLCRWLGSGARDLIAGDRQGDVVLAPLAEVRSHARSDLGRTEHVGDRIRALHERVRDFLD